jgi:hypothetical protein
MFKAVGLAWWNWQYFGFQPLSACWLAAY